MTLNEAIIVKDVYKKYKLYHSARERILDLMLPASYGKDFYALNNVNFVAEQGDIVGFIGINGSGKSTLSNIIAGIVPETSGSVETYGQTSLIAVNAGLRGDLTGRDNIELKCLMLGFNQEEIQELEPDIIDFSELEEFIDQPVKSYSSGMKSRLGFAISVSIDPDILIIDEALSVGDKAFAEKSLQKMNEFKEMGKTMIFVSHSIGQMKKFCKKILWLEFGRVKDYGETDDVIPKYEAFLDQWQKMTKDERDHYKKLAFEEKHEDMKAMLQQPEPVSENYRETPVSLLAHIRGNSTYIYDSLKSDAFKKSAEEYTHSVYYVKKKATWGEEVFYLLSNQPSAQKGVVGWMKQEEIATHEHIVIDNDYKTFKVEGSGPGYSKPWGGSKNAILDTLKTFKDALFYIEQTDKVGNNIWYYGELEGQRLWVHSQQLSECVMQTRG